MNDKTGRSSKLRLLLLFLMPGIIILTVVFEIQTNIEKNRANTDASVIINFMKEECVRYEKIYAQDDMEDQFSIEDILTGYKVERAGIIVLTDVSTTDNKGKTRLRKVSKECQNYGQRVQNTVKKILRTA